MTTPTTVSQACTSPKPTQIAAGWVRRVRTRTVIGRSVAGAAAGGGCQNDEQEEGERAEDGQRDHDPAHHQPGHRHAVAALARLADLLAGHVAGDHRDDRADERDDGEPADAGHQGDHGQRVVGRRRCAVLGCVPGGVLGLDAVRLDAVRLLGVRLLAVGGLRVLGLVRLLTVGLPRVLRGGALLAHDASCGYSRRLGVDPRRSAFHTGPRRWAGSLVFVRATRWYPSSATGQRPPDRGSHRMSSIGWRVHGDGRQISPGTVVAPDERLSWPRTIGIGLQHVVAMFGATILVPAITGFPASTTLFFSAVGTVLFLVITGNRLPSYLGSSFAFIAPVLAAMASGGISVATGGI